jgi:alkylation response protein AidB-like acyl-CoA dehydrogenase
MSDQVVESEEHSAFRAEAIEWLSANGSLRTGPDDWSTQRHHTTQEGLAAYAAKCRDWQRKVWDGGWAAISVEEQYGGGGGTSTQARIFNEEMVKYDVTSGFLSATIAMLATALRVHGTEEQKRHYLPRLYAADDQWCQLFSEPGAGSDLAGLGCRAVRDGDEFVINGQKVWNSMAHMSDWGFLIVRTNPDVPKHQGVTFLLVDMKTDGIDARPLVQAHGAAHFCEVFFNDVRVPVSNVVGEIDKGWGVTRTVLAAESQFIGGGGADNEAARLISLAQSLGKNTDPILRQKLAAFYGRQQINRWMATSMMGAVRAGKKPPFSGALLKLFIVEQRKRNGDLYMDLLGPAGIADVHRESEHGQVTLIGQFGVSIGGGTTEVGKNNVGEGDLGLPREPRNDKDVPWKDVPKG